MDRTVPQLLAGKGRPTLSLEFFPPKTPLDFGVLGSSIERMRPVKPDFVTCTYGAGGGTREFSFAAWELLRRMDFTPVVAHLTCVGATREDLEGQVDRIWGAGIRNIMALRGDPPRGETEFRAPEGGLAHASDLVRLVKGRHPDICCGVGGYPETHPEAASAEEDVRRLKEKLDAGADFVNTQLFFDNDAYFRFRDRCDAAGIRAPLFPGLMPVATAGQLRRAVGLSRAAIPAALERGLEERGEEAGVEWLVGQIRGLVAGGAPGIHLYILNKANTLLDPRLAACLAEWRL